MHRSEPVHRCREDRFAGADTPFEEDIAVLAELEQAAEVISLRGPNRTVDFVVADPAQFKLIAKGDQVEAKYTQALPLTVEPAVKK